MKDLHCFLIYTEHQTMQLDRAIDYYHIPLSKVIIILYINKNLHRDLNWIAKLKIKYDCCQSIFQYKDWTSKKIHLITLRKEIIKYKWDLLKLKSKVVSLYTSQYGDAALIAYKILGKPNFTLLDEGTASYNVVTLRKKKVPVKTIINQSIAHLMLFNYPKKINFFSQYKLPLANDDTIDNYEFIKTKNKLLLDDKSILLLGSSLTEVNIINESDYLYIINAVSRRFSNTILYYYPHRKENRNKINKIERLGFIIQENICPFELFFPSLNKCSATVLCFASPILGNILQMFTITPKCIMIKPSPNYYLENPNVYMDIYNHYSTNEQIEIWEIE